MHLIGCLIFLLGCSGSDSESLTNPIAGKLIINVIPETTNAPWVLAGPNGYSERGSGSGELTELEAGEYSIGWGLVPGWISPEGQMFDYDPSSGMALSGEFLGSIEHPESPTVVFNNLKLCYELMLVNESGNLFHPAFRAFVDEATIEEWRNGGFPIENGYFSASQILEIHESLLGGLEGVGPSGQAIPKVVSIGFESFVSPSSWETVSPETPYFGAIPGVVKAHCNFYGYFNNPSNHRFESGFGGDIYFAATEGQWKIVGWGSPPPGSKPLELKATEKVGYHSLLAMFR